MFINNVVVGNVGRSETGISASEPWAMSQSYCRAGGDCTSLVWNNTFVLNAPPDSDGVTVSNKGAWHFTQAGFINNIVAFNHVGGVYGNADPTDPEEYSSFHHNDVYGNPTCQYCFDDPPRETVYPDGPHYQ